MTYDRGIFFGDKEIYEFVSDIDIYTDYTPKYPGEPYAHIWVSLQRTKMENNVEYPRLPEVFA